LRKVGGIAVGIYDCRLGRIPCVLKIHYWNAVLLAVENKILIGIPQRSNVGSVIDEQPRLLLNHFGFIV
jgi:hypothetical protein